MKEYEKRVFYALNLALLCAFNFLFTVLFEGVTRIVFGAFTLLVGIVTLGICVNALWLIYYDK